MDKSVPNMVLLRGNKMKTKRHETQRKYRTVKKGNKITVFDDKGNIVVTGEIIDPSEIPPIRRQRRKRK